MKVKFNDKVLLKKVDSCFMMIGTILGFVALFYNELIIKYKLIVILVWLIMVVTYYTYSLVKMNKMKSISLSIHGSNFEIKSGNIFESPELKVINFNEYFDTQVDDKIIAKNSLNGQFIQKVLNNNTEKLDKEIETQLKEKTVEKNDNRKLGKKNKYNLGEIVVYEDYLLTSLTKFTEDNRATISLKEYLEFLMNFWDNLDKIYSGRSVVISLFGSSSLTRFTDAYEISDQDLIEIIIWTFKISKIKFKYPSKITMLLSNNLINKINLYKIKEMYKNGL